MSASSSKPVSVFVDEDLCVASAVCTSLAPDLFEIPDGSDTAVVRMSPLTDPQLVALAREAEDNCPAFAIRVIDD